MTVSELWQTERALLKEMTLKEKLGHIWHYYKWYFIALVLLISYISSTIASFVSTNNCVLNGYFINVTGDTHIVTGLSDAFLPDQREQLVYLDTMFLTSDPSKADAADVAESLQNLVAKSHAGDVDFLVVGDGTLSQMIYYEFFQDLTQVLTPEQYEAYKDRFLYMDRAFLERISKIDASTDLTVTIHYPDPTDPESMEDPIPVLIDVRDSQWMEKLYPGSKGMHAYGFVVNSQHRQNAVDFLEFLLSGDEAP